MPAGKHKSRTLRRVFIKTPGKKSKIHYEKRNMKTRECGLCRGQLHGIPRMIHSKFKKLPKTKKRPQRPYGGVLCSACTRKKIISQVENV